MFSTIALCSTNSTGVSINNMCSLVKLKCFCISKDTTIQAKQQPTQREIWDDDTSSRPFLIQDCFSYPIFGYDFHIKLSIMRWKILTPSDISSISFSKDLKFLIIQSFHLLDLELLEYILYYLRLFDFFLSCFSFVY